MMLIFGIFLTIALGFVIVNVISPRFTLTESVGLSFLLGMGIQTILMVIMDQIGIPLTGINLLIGGLLLFIVFCYLLFPRRKMLMRKVDNSFSLRSLWKDFNLVWLFLILLIVALEYMNLSKCLYYPPFDRDSLVGFDTLGYVIAQEHTLKGLSLFNESYIPGIHGAGSYISYTPLVQLSYAYVYALGTETSKIATGLFYLFFLLAFYGVTCRLAGKTGAALATLFMLFTPEMIAFSSLSITNVVHAIYASLSVIYMSLWLRERKKRDLFLCGILLGLNIWCRMEGIVFTGSVLLLLLIDSIRRKEYKNFLWVAGFGLLPLVIWGVFTKINGMYAESIAILHPFWDSEKFDTILTYMISLYKNLNYYGWTFLAFAVAFLLNIGYILKERDNLNLLFAILISAVFYIVVLYQIDYKWDIITNVLSYSAKRFLFCFAPLAWYYAFTNKTTLLALRKMDEFLVWKKQ